MIAKATKAEIAGDYLDTCKRLYGGLDRRDHRKAMVIGSNRQNNIGAKVSRCLAQSGDHHVVEYDWPALDIRNEIDLARAYSKHRPDTLVICSGMTWLDWIENQPPELIHDVVDVNLVGPMKAVSVFVDKTLHEEYLKYIVVIGSMAYRSVLNASAPYCASKAGLAHFIRCAGWELTPKGYRIFCVHPSNVEGTPMTEVTIDGIKRYRQIDREEAEEYWGATNLMDDWLQPADVAAQVRLLVSGQCDYLSGTSIEMSGGQR